MKKPIKLAIEIELLHSLYSSLEITTWWTCRY